MKRLLTLALLLSGFAVQAQEAGADADWSLQRSVQYALAHNISIQQSVLNERLAALNLKQSRLSQLPNVNGSFGYGRSYGRSVDPTTNQFVKGNYDFLSTGGNADVLLFGWFQKRRVIEQSGLNRQAAQADLEQLRNDVSLNVATGYLRALLAREQIGVNQKQVELSAAQLEQTRAFAQSGRLPELNVAQLESQLATDSAALITAMADYTASVLDLKALLNLDFEAPFELVAPGVEQVDRSAALSYTPEAIYTEARKYFGAVRSAELKLASANKGLQAARSGRYPQLTLNAQLGSNFASTYKDYKNPILTGSQQTGTFVDINGSPYPIYQPTYAFNDISTTPLNAQLGNNLRQTYSININVPLFNGWQQQAAVRQARIQVQNQELNRYQSLLKLRQDVYKAHNDARNSIQKFAAAERAAAAAARAYEYARGRYELGLTNTIEYLTTQNNQYRAEASLLSAKYDMVFRLKVLDYYLGRELKL